MKCMDFSCALKVLKLGKCIYREKYSQQYYVDNNKIKMRCGPYVENAIFSSDDILATDWAVMIDNPPLV